MSRALYIIGAPGTGKTTLLRNYLTHRAHLPGPETRIHGQLWAQPITTHGQPIGYLLGRHRPPFSGTDALGMTVITDALNWLNNTPPSPYLCGEGQRLTTTKWLIPLSKRYRLTVIHLHRRDAPQLRAQRGTQQNPTWVTAAATRAANTAQATRQSGIPTHHLDQTGLTPEEAVHQLHNTLHP